MTFLVFAFVSSLYSCDFGFSPTLLRRASPIGDKIEFAAHQRPDPSQDSQPCSFPEHPLLSYLAEPSTAASLLNATRDGQPEAWQRFVHLYGPLIYRWVRRCGMQSSDAADVTQDVLISVSKDLYNFDPTRRGATFRGWLWTITRRRIADALRARPNEQLAGSGINDLPAELSVVDPPTDASLDRQTLLVQAVAIYRDRFDPKTWKAFWATVVEGREPDEVAESLGMKRWSVYKARARILQRLRTELAGIWDEDNSDNESG